MSGEDDEYQLVANNDLEALRKELEEVKKNPTGDYASSLTLIESMDRLTEQISRLLAVFEHANQDVHEEYVQSLKQESNKLDTVIKQNERIAKGVLALADKQPSSESTQIPSQEQEGSYPLSEEPARSDKQASSSSPKPTSGSRRSLIREFR